MTGREKNRAAGKRSRKAGHRTWAARNQPVPGEHEGDIMSPQTRSQVMSRIRSRYTRPERTVFDGLEERKLEFERHVSDLPGSPDVVLKESRIAVFVDGDFWHGWRFPLWKHKLSKKWQDKIMATRRRDQRNFRKLRRRGWKVIRLWEHQIDRAPAACIERIAAAHQRRS